MSLRTWLRDRRLPATIVVLALLAGGAQLLLWWIEPQVKTTDFVGPPRSGYTLSNARVTEFNVEGVPSFHVQSPHVERREGDESLYFNSPTFQIPAKKPGIPDWDGNSLYGWTDRAGMLLKLQGPVHMHRPPYADQDAVDMQTSDVTAWPKENRMETAAPARIVQGPRTMSGVGMRANLTDNHMELLDESQGTFPPRKRKS
ncbi:LPS export ABC transporter periplasmic protein LptC [Rhodanobacter sp. L36]|uniref:LPS export ABC transporter periplasmic protein LptC n=1 Tax=Rhodanobacter sp. L36 TaxID=1747221 RepID=UPI00131E1A1A|nr:LPS export ABC transporter periplasmic protein LptC [Rhodanobacter sp. L36]